jgi:fructose-specific phosphotransferase system component IIB
MHWLIMHADQVIGGAEQMTANIKIQTTGAEGIGNGHGRLPTADLER